MGEEEKKPEAKKEEAKQPQQQAPEEKKAEGGKVEKKDEEKKKKADEPKKDDKKEEKKAEDSKEQAAPPPPPPPQEIVLKVYMHCEGCARKVRRSLKGFDGVEEVITDCRSHKVVVKGEKADPLKVLQRVQKKSHRQVELLSPIPKPPSEEPKPPAEEPPKAEEKKEEPQVITVVLKVHMHCEACAQEIKKRILRMKGVESAEADLKNSQVAVKGVMEAQKLVEYVHKRTGKHATIVKQEPEKKESEAGNGAAEEKKGGEEAGGGGEKKKGDQDGGDEKKESAGKPEGDGNGGEAKGEGEGGAEESKVVEILRKNEYYYYPPDYATKYAVDLYPTTFHPAAAYPPQIFSDENPNACSIM